MKKHHNIFISHSWKYSEHYNKLIDFLNSDSNFSFKDYSIPKNDPIHKANNEKQLYEAIKNQISLCSVILIPIGMYASFSKWIDKEIYIAKEEFWEPKKIIAIEPWGAKRTSTIVDNKADKVVGWNSNSIIQAIKELSY